MERKKPLLYLLTVHIFLSCLLLVGEARISRNLALMNRAILSIDETYQVANVEISVEERFVEGRMDFESSDYPVSGANNRHEPRAPGRP